MRELPFRLHVGPSDAGWCDFQVDLFGGSWKCRASYLGCHPIAEFLVAALQLHEYFYEDSSLPEEGYWDCSVVDEPGGITVRLTPEEGALIRVEVFPFSESWPRNAGRFPNVPAAASETLDYWDFADAVTDEVCRVVARQGFTGLLRSFRCGNLSDYVIDGYRPEISFHLFMFLVVLVRDRKPRFGLTFDEELEILADIRRKYRKP